MLRHARVDDGQVLVQGLEQRLRSHLLRGIGETADVEEKHGGVLKCAAEHLLRLALADDPLVNLR